MSCREQQCAYQEVPVACPIHAAATTIEPSEEQRCGVCGGTGDLYTFRFQGVEIGFTHRDCVEAMYGKVSPQISVEPVSAVKDEVEAREAYHKWALTRGPHFDYLNAELAYRAGYEAAKKERTQLPHSSHCDCGKCADFWRRFASAEIRRRKVEALEMLETADVLALEREVKREADKRRAAKKER